MLSSFMNSKTKIRLEIRINQRLEIKINLLIKECLKFLSITDRISNAPLKKNFKRDISIISLRIFV